MRSSYKLEENKFQEVKDCAIIKYCIISCLFSVGFMLMPMLLPLIMADHEIRESMTGIILAIPLTITAIGIPLLKKYLIVIGLENIFLYSNIAFSFSVGAMGFGLSAGIKINIFLTSTLLTTLVFGISLASNIVAENVLLIRYS
jgi:hypothetical protein